MVLGGVGGVQAGGSVEGGFSGGNRAKGQTLGGLKEQTLVGGGGGELNGIFLQFEFRFRNGLCRTLALQSFRITHLINAEIFAKNGKTRKTKIKWTKINFNMISDLL